MAGRDGRNLHALWRNPGSAYAQVGEGSLQRCSAVLARFEGGNYILPGARKATALKAETDITGGAAKLHIAFDDGKTQVFDIALP